VTLVRRLRALFRTGLVAAFVNRLLGRRPRWPRPPALGEPVDLPFARLEGHNCFACSGHNPAGLQLAFHQAEGWALACRWQVTARFENYPGMLHGGIAATILDEIIGQAIFRQEGHLPVSLTANVAWCKPVNVGDTVIAAARLTDRLGGLYVAEAFLFRPDGKVAASARGRYYTPPLAQFQRMAELDQVPEVARGWFAPGRRAARAR
jgi:uncharacterized protein (TIGR00369 family)